MRKRGFYYEHGGGYHCSPYNAVNITLFVVGQKGKSKLIT